MWNMLVSGTIRFSTGASAQTRSSDTMKALQPARVSKGPLAGSVIEGVDGVMSCFR